MPENSDSGTPGSAGGCGAQRRTTKIIPTKNTALRQERVARPDPRGQQRPRAPGRSARDDVHRDRAERHRLRHVGALDELVDARLLRRHVERERDADHEGEGEQRPRRHAAGQRGDAEHDGAGEEQRPAWPGSPAGARRCRTARRRRSPNRMVGAVLAVCTSATISADGVMVAMSHAAMVACIV